MGQKINPIGFRLGVQKTGHLNGSLIQKIILHY
jgi:hypothetical protein